MQQGGQRRIFDRITLSNREVWDYKTSLIPPLFNEVPVARQEGERTYM
jgi:hypothetical protein